MCSCPDIRRLAGWVQRYKLHWALEAEEAFWICCLWLTMKTYCELLNMWRHNVAILCREFHWKLLTEAVMWSCEPIANTGRRFVDEAESPTREKLRRRMIGFTVSSTQS